MEEGEGDDAVHNWDNVLCGYFNGSAGIAVEDAFMRAGYNQSNIRATILRAMREFGYGTYRIAHGKGDRGSKVRHGTEEAIEECKNKMIVWAQGHSTGGFGKKKSRNKRGHRRGDSDDENITNL